MGLSATQTSIFMLTAQRNDLELRAQNITNQKMMLARQQETVAAEYSDAVGNRQLMIRVADEDGTKNNQNLNLDELLKAGYGFEYQGVKYKHITNSSELKKDGDTYTLDGISITTTSKDNAEIVKVFNEQVDTQAKSVLGDCNGEGEWNNPLQDLLINGGAKLWDKKGAKEITVAGAPDIYETYYSGDDAAAEAEYTAEMNRLERKEKQLDVTAENIETQHTAVVQNIDNYRKVIDKNIEASKVFTEG